MSRKTKDDSTDLIDSYRLAGQIVTYLSNGKVIRFATIQGKAEKCNMELSQRKDIADPERARLHVEMHIESEFCGDIAVAAFSHTTKPKFDINTVDRELYKEARSACGSDDETDAFMLWLWCRAENVYSRDGTWVAVGNIANELIRTRTVSGMRAKELYDNAIQAAKY
ncbi:MAG: hypothetical protein ABR985_17745 [Methanotrichaceae archaeon]|jgi:hypothetical protein